MKPKPTSHRKRRSFLPVLLAGLTFVVLAGGSAIAISVMPEKAVSNTASRCGTRAPLRPLTAPTASPAPNTATRFVLVRQGDSLGSIAQRELGDFNQWRALAWLNHKPPPYDLTLGEKILLPKGKK